MNEPLILYVDDERANRVVFEQSFRARFSIRCASSGDEALAILREGLVAVLVTDQRMPGMSGEELLEQARVLCPSVIRVVITAYGDIDPILRAVNNGLVARYLVKPWDRAELEQILTWAVEAHALAQQDSSLQLRLMQTERLITVGTISAAVLHDLQQPLVSLQLNIERLAEHVNVLRPVLGALPAESTGPGVRVAIAELADLVEDLGLATGVMKGIVGHLREFVRPGRVGRDPQAAPSVDPRPAIQYASSICREIAGRAGGQVVCESVGELPAVRIGATELTQVLINLIANAANAIGRGGRVVIDAVAVPEGVRFTIKDDGAGMTPEVLRKAGTPFFSTREQGTGLGLSQCHRLLGAIGARLELESEQGIGTTIRFTIPTAA